MPPINSVDRNIHVAVAQLHPAPSDLAGSLAKVLAAVAEAAANGAKLICFGETVLPGYPVWLDCCEGVALWDHPLVKKTFAELRANSVLVPGAETEAISQAAADFKMGIAIGVNEYVRDGPGHGTLYNALLFFSEDGRLTNHHRKLMPTYSERLVWGQGDSAGLRCSKIHGVNFGGLICWEHWMPLARQHMHSLGEQVHVAAWPTVHEMHQVASRHYAFEGRCFVLAAGQILRGSDLPSGLSPVPALGPETLIERGGSAILGPNGDYLAGPVFDEETILYATLDLQLIDQESMTLDVSGHYSRPDIFDLKVNLQDRSS